VDVVTSGNQTLPKMDVSMENSMNIIPICPMVLEYLPTFARTKSPSHVGKFTIHGAYGLGSKNTSGFLKIPAEIPR
jgi:hypothetical protein